VTPVNGNIVAGIVDQDLIGNGSATVHWTQQEVSSILKVTFTLAVTTDTAGDGYGVDLIWGDPAPTTYIGADYTGTCTNFSDALTCFDNIRCWTWGRRMCLNRHRPACSVWPSPCWAGCSGSGWRAPIEIVSLPRRFALRWRQPPHLQADPHHGKSGRSTGCR
jgi:hypothetical protein